VFGVKKAKVFLGATLLIFILIQKVFADDVSAVTFPRTKKRLGNHLLNYVKAKWLSYRHNIPLYCPHFKYSDQFMLHRIEKKYYKGLRQKFKKVFYVKRGRSVSIKVADSCLYKIHLFAHIHFDWEDECFVNEIKKNISPITPIEKPDIPKGCISVAVHVRRGGGYDAPLLSGRDDTVTKGRYADKRYPLKFPPDTYFIDQIKKLYDLFGKQAMYVYIFTDDKNPEHLLSKYEKAINKKNITFDSRKNGNSYNNNVLEDLFAMKHYDCLIRGRSSFAIIADIIGDFFVVIYPVSKKWNKNNLIITNVKMKINMKHFHKLSKLVSPYFLVSGFTPIDKFNVYRIPPKRVKKRRKKRRKK